MSDDAIPAATLIVVRERGGAAPELLMVERAQGMAFAAGALVFPGGRIDAADRELGDELGIDAAAVAAIRETLEETAVPVGLVPRPELRRSDRASAGARRRCSLSRDCLAQPALRSTRLAHALRALGSQIPRGAPLRHLVLRRALPAGRLAAATSSKANAPAPNG